MKLFIARHFGLMCAASAGVVATVLFKLGFHAVGIVAALLTLLIVGDAWDEETRA